MSNQIGLNILQLGREFLSYFNAFSTVKCDKPENTQENTIKPITIRTSLPVCEWLNYFRGSPHISVDNQLLVKADIISTLTINKVCRLTLYDIIIIKPDNTNEHHNLMYQTCNIEDFTNVLFIVAHLIKNTNQKVYIGLVVKNNDTILFYNCIHSMRHFQ